MSNLRTLASRIEQWLTPGRETTVAFILPLIVIIFGLYQLYPPIGWVDPFLYIYNFLNLPDVAHISQHQLGGLDYHSTRLPFLLVGYLSNKIFGAPLAQAFVVVFFYMLGLASLVAIARAFVSSSLARLALVWVVALNPVWIASFFEGHVDGASMAFCLLSFAALLADRPRLLGLPREWWAGVAVALALSTQPFAGGIAGLVLLITGMLAEGAWRARLVYLGWAALGGVCVLLTLGLVAALLGLPFLYLLTSDDWIGRFFAGATHETVIAPEQWLPTASRVALWPLALVLLAWTAQWRGLGRLSRPAAFLTAVTIWTVLFFLVTLAAHGFFAQFRFYASYIFLSIMPGLAAVLERFKDQTGAASRWWMALIAIVFAFGNPVLAGMFRADADAWRPLWVWGVLGVLGLAIIVCYRLNKRRLGFTGIALFLALSACANRDTVGIFSGSVGPSRRAGFIAVSEVQKAIADAGAGHKRVFFWFNRDDFSRSAGPSQRAIYSFQFAGQHYEFNLFDSISGIHGWNRAALGFDMPKLDEMADWPFADLQRVPTSFVILCAHPGDCQQGSRVLAARGILLRPELLRTIAVAGFPPFTVLIVEVEHPT